MAGWTKRAFVERAYREIGVFDPFDIQPDMLVAAGNDLDAMMASWNAKGIRIGYPSSTPVALDLDEETGITDMATEAVYKNLAVRIAPTIGREVLRGTEKVARQAYMALLSLATQPRPMQLRPETPAGAGNQPLIYGNPFLPQNEEEIDTGPDGILELDP